MATFGRSETVARKMNERLLSSGAAVQTNLSGFSALNDR
jgi:hypothetical protein